MLSGVISTPMYRAAAWREANSAAAEGKFGTRTIPACVTRGATCLRSSSHFPLKLYSNSIKPVVLPPGPDRVSTKPSPTGSVTAANTIGKVWVTRCNAATLRVPLAKMTSGASATSSATYSRSRSTSSSPPAGFNPHIVTVAPSQLLQGVPECQEAGLTLWIVRGSVHEHPDPPYLPALLRARRDRPCG